MHMNEFNFLIITAKEGFNFLKFIIFQLKSLSVRDENISEEIFFDIFQK